MSRRTATSASCAARTLGRLLRRAAEGVEDLPLRVDVEQRLRLVLPVEVHEQPTDLREDARGDRRSIHPCAGAAVRAHLAPQYDGVVLDVHAALIENRRRGRVTRDVEHALDDGAVGAGSDEVAARALAKQQPKRADDDRLPGSRLAGQHVEAGSQRERRATR